VVVGQRNAGICVVVDHVFCSVQDNTAPYMDCEECANVIAPNGNMHRFRLLCPSSSDTISATHNINGIYVLMGDLNDAKQNVQS
jgi:hypothetical protein